MQAFTINWESLLAADIDFTGRDIVDGIVCGRHTQIARKSRTRNSKGFRVNAHELRSFNFSEIKLTGLSLTIARPLIVDGKSIDEEDSSSIPNIGSIELQIYLVVNTPRHRRSPWNGGLEGVSYLNDDALNEKCKKVGGHRITYDLTAASLSWIC